ncbi:YfhO family protein [Flavobacterium columnare]|uniref:YfhO family protein n=1 Tax=Flavobacterium columnare TaxID=996 RepID=A0AA94EY56_9FLAO|nr:YfhO family protein [Flavobacterium columnare]MCH4828505.1 YfhO family protein [Flavobacterium columnare]MCH4831759.1 YfhO family protein [Flavobacterium columnare]
MNNLKRFYPHALAIIGFVLVAIIYFYPVLNGKKILQSDIVQYTAMAKEQNDFRSQYKEEPYWTNSAFGGMPTYQLGANYPHNYIKKIDSIIRFLPRPADYLFLYFLGFYILLMALRIKPLKAFFGALAFGFSTYLIIILGVGHNAKAHAIAYMPMVVAGVLMVFQKRWIIGGILTMLAAALELNANHFQMTYYLFIFLLVLTSYYVYKAIKEDDLKELIYSFGIFVVSGIISIGVNATGILATQEYAKESTRGKNELTFSPDGKKNNTETSMTYDYITEYSYGLAESLNLISPRIFGGSNSENIGTKSAMYNFVLSQEVPEDQAKEIVKGLPTYWGDQPIVAAPAYIGAIVFFLAVLALFIDKRKIKYAFLIGAIVSLVLSWGKNFPLLTDFFIYHIPFYDKFRAVSSIQVVLELCMPVLAVLGLQSYFISEEKEQKEGLMKASLFSIGTLLLILLCKSLFSFSGSGDGYFIDSYGPGFVDALKEDRKSLFTSDLLRSMLLILLTAGTLFLSFKKTISQKAATWVVGLLMVTDLFLIAKNYVNSSDFVNASEVDTPFIMAPFDEAILQDKSHYRVFEVSQNVMSDPRASYFHKSIGGYHAAKPRRMQELFDYQIAKNNIEVLNMLNVKYLIQKNEKGEQFPIRNQQANGNAWFVKSIKFVKSADEEMKSLSNFNSRSVAILNTVSEKSQQLKETKTISNENAKITLQSYKSNDLKYESINPKNGFAVFSEIYYGKGWNAYIDGKLVDHYRVDYILRGLPIPAGKHSIEFKFEPQVVKTGSIIALISFILMIGLIIGGIYLIKKKSIN